MSDATIESCILRRVEFKDSERVTELLRNLGLVLPEGQKEIHKHWQRLWIDNPALQIKGASPARGWVLENAERMVGFLGNIPLLYDYG